MADLGTSGGLQGIYQGDSAQNRPAYIKPKPNTFGDDIIAEMDKQEKRKKDEQDAFDKQINPFVSIDGTKYLPERVPLIKEQSQRVLQEAYKVKSKKGNVMLDENVNREITKLQELQNKYSREASIANDFQKKMLTDQAFEYDDATKEEVAKAIEGRAGLNDEKYISSDYIDKGRNFTKYRKPEDRAKFLANYAPNAGDEIVTRVMENGVYVDKVTKGSQVYETPEGVASQKERFYNLAKTSQSPFVRGWMREAEEGINANDDLVFQENFKDLTPLQAQDFIAQRAADLMLEEAMNTNKLKTVDRRTKIPTGFNFTNNFQSTGGGGAVGKIWSVGDPIDQPLYETTAEGKPIVEKPLVKNGKFFSIELVAGAENPKNIYLKGYSNAAIVGLTRNEDTGVAEYATIEMPEKKGRGGRIIPAEKKYVKIGAEDISSIRNNIGAGQYDASIGKWEKPKEKAKKETPKAEPKKEAMYIVNGVAYPKSKLEKSGYDISKLKEYK
jgi:hypothetical protein